VRSIIFQTEKVGSKLRNNVEFDILGDGQTFKLILDNLVIFIATVGFVNHDTDLRVFLQVLFDIRKSPPASNGACFTISSKEAWNISIIGDLLVASMVLASFALDSMDHEISRGEGRRVPLAGLAAALA